MTNVGPWMSLSEGNNGDFISATPVVKFQSIVLANPGFAFVPALVDLPVGYVTMTTLDLVCWSNVRVVVVGGGGRQVDGEARRDAQRRRRSQAETGGGGRIYTAERLRGSLASGVGM